MLIAKCTLCTQFFIKTVTDTTNNTSDRQKVSGNIFALVLKGTKNPKETSNDPLSQILKRLDK